MRDFRPLLALLLVLSLGGCDRAKEWWAGDDAAEAESEPDAEPEESETERKLRLEKEKAELARLEAERLEREKAAAEERKRKLEEADAMVERWANELAEKKNDRNMFEVHEGLTDEDPWGQRIRASYHGSSEDEEHRLEVRSAGPDGKFHTDDDLTRERTSTIEHSWWEQNGRLTIIVVLWLLFGLVSSYGLTSRHHRKRDESIQGIDVLDVLLFIGGIVFAPLAVIVWVFLLVLEILFD